MAEITAIKTGKAPIEHVAAKLTPGEVNDIVANYVRNGYVPSWLRKLERAAKGDTNTLSGAPSYSFADMVAGRF